jgi:hypothetical protein
MVRRVKGLRVTCTTAPCEFTLGYVVAGTLKLMWPPERQKLRANS